MKDMGIIHGSKEQAIPLVVGFDTVYVHTGIKEVELEDSFGNKYTEWEYHEVQYTKDEYIKKLSNDNEELKSNTTDLQLAIIEIYESSLML